MSNDILVLLAWTTMAFVCGQMAIGVWYWLRARAYRRIARTEFIRLRLGDARCRLFNAAARGELSTESATFKQLYVAQTYLMRGTDKYAEFSDAYWTKLMRFEKRGSSAMAREAKSWSPEIQAITKQTAEAIRLIWIAYMPFGTFLWVFKQCLIKQGLVSYDAFERLCDRVLQGLIRVAETTAPLTGWTHVSRERKFTEVRFVHDVRETERLLRKALAKAA